MSVLFLLFLHIFSVEWGSKTNVRTLIISQKRHVIKGIPHSDTIRRFVLNSAGPTWCALSRWLRAHQVGPALFNTTLRFVSECCIPFITCLFVKL